MAQELFADRSFCRFNEIEIQINLANSRIHSTANGTTIFTRIIAIICLSFPVVMAMDILASDETEIEKSDDYSSPGPQLFITAFLFSTIPFYWIIFNVELRNYVIRKVSRRCQPLDIINLYIVLFVICHLPLVITIYVYGCEFCGNY